MSAAIITLCVAVATFILQEGITNIIHGIIFRLFSGVHNGDRIEISVDGTFYTGIVSKITVRHMVIYDIQTNAEIAIPNSKVDVSVIRNSYNGLDKPNKYIVELPVNYSDAENESKSTMIKETIHKVIADCELTTKDTPSIILNYRDSYVGYSFFVITNSVEKNFKACSWVKEHLMQELAKNDIHIPYNVLDVNINNK